MPISSSRFPPWNLQRRGKEIHCEMEVCRSNDNMSFCQPIKLWEWVMEILSIMTHEHFIELLKISSDKTYLARKWVIPNSGRDCHAWMKRILASMRLIWATFWWASRIRAEIWQTHNHTHCDLVCSHHLRVAKNTNTLPTVKKMHPITTLKPPDAPRSSHTPNA